jgi:DNA integrity scanning protein DisA with diadenylate cyclase activity
MIEDADLLDDILIQERSINLQTLSDVVTLAVEIAREGREGRRIGTLFIISDEEHVLAKSKPLILDPLWHHPSHDKQVRNPNVRETIKEPAQLDGAFVVADDGTVLSACRYINSSAEGIFLPLGLGSRHMAAVSISKTTNSIAVVVSESSMVRVFDNGELISEIIPELWLLKTHSLHIKGIYSTRSGKQLTIASKTTDDTRSDSQRSELTRPRNAKLHRKTVKSNRLFKPFEY